MPDFPYKLINKTTGERVGTGKALNICCEEHFLAALEVQAANFSQEFGCEILLEPMSDEEYDSDPLNAEMESMAVQVVEAGERAASAPYN